ncbi:MAG: 16S rRNA (uracil(1498)-N(3))-methyltransferase, partial [Agathobacter sp.]|nr:16S rRNA (uracil(1498)-N(3))-methyltransferase [Agathobacter sp.]
RGMEATRDIMKQIQPGQSIAIFIGPEGGFALEEIEGICPTNKGDGVSQVLEEKSHRISLGRRILRTETAGLATLSMLIFCLDE